MPGVGLMVMGVGLGSLDLEFKSHSAVELIPGGVDSACHPVLLMQCPISSKLAHILPTSEG